MAFPFFNRAGTGPLKISLPEIVRVAFGVYFDSRASGIPEEQDLKSIVATWASTHVSEPLPGVVQDFLARPGMLQFMVPTVHEVPLPPLPVMLALGLGEEEEQRLPATTHVVMVVAHDTLRYPRLGLMAAWVAAKAIAARLGGLLYDPERYCILPMAGYDDRIDDPWLPVSTQLRMPFSADERGHGWLTTVGMTKYGLPNLEVRDVPPSLEERVSLMVNGVAQRLVRESMQLNEGRSSPATELVLGPDIRLDILDITQAFGDDGKERPEGVPGATAIRFAYLPAPRGRERLLAVTPPAAFKGKTGVWLYHAFGELWGADERVSQIQGDSEMMEAASRRALAALPDVARRFADGLPPSTSLFVKVPFRTRRGHPEYMWVVVRTWQGDRIDGVLANDPIDVPGMRAGQSVTCAVRDVFDWLISHPDGQMEGGVTNKALEAEGRDISR